MDHNYDGMVSGQLTNKVGQTFKQMALKAIWTDPDTTMQFLTVALLNQWRVIPSDVLSLLVLEGGRELTIKSK